MQKFKVIGPEGAQVLATDWGMTLESEEMLRDRIVHTTRVIEESATPNLLKLDRIRRDAELILMDRRYGKER